MAKKRKVVHPKTQILIKLIENIGEFSSDEEIAAIARRILGENVDKSRITKVRDNYTDIQKVEGYRKQNYKHSCADRYDHKNIREFLDKHQSQCKMDVEKRKGKNGLSK